MLYSSSHAFSISGEFEKEEEVMVRLKFVCVCKDGRRDSCNIVKVCIENLTVHPPAVEAASMI